MANVNFKGNPVQTSGKLPVIGSAAPDFHLVKSDLSEADLTAFKGKKKILNIFISLDTPVCAISVENFNKQIQAIPNTAVINISKDLPFAQKRFCETKKIGAETLSAFRSSFGKDYGVEIVEGPLKGLLARAVIVLDESNKVLYTELVSEITNEPNYKAALEALKSKAGV